MSYYEFIIDNIKFSYSSISTFDTCPYSFKLTYIDRLDRANNFFGEYGLLTHQCFEEYFNGNLESYELSKFYTDKYYEFCVTPPPPYPAGMEENYKRQGKAFFDNFAFDIENYDVVAVEDELEFKLGEATIVGRPDLILRDKRTNENILVDYKSSIVFRENKYTGNVTTDKKKLNGYYRQMYLYSYGIRKQKGIQIDKIFIWFTRPEKRHVIKWKESGEKKAIKWVEDTLEKIMNEEKFPPDTSSKYFCDNICSVREFCEYR